jgi:hypothetical protein
MIIETSFLPDLVFMKDFVLSRKISRLMRSVKQAKLMVLSSFKKRSE